MLNIPAIAQGVTSVILAIGVIIFLKMALQERINSGKGIGWQVIRYSTIASALPIAGILALNNVLTGEAATIIGGALGYAFAAKSDGP